MAYYDPHTDKIVGCEKGSYAWYHENRHRWQYKRFIWLEDISMKVHIVGYYAAIISSLVSFLSYGFINALLAIGLSMFPHILLTAIVEFDAYVMGFRDWVKK